MPSDREYRLGSGAHSQSDRLAVGCTPIASAGTPSALWGWWWDAHATRRPALPGGLQPGDHLVLWSGGVGDAPFENDPRTWMEPGRAAFAAGIEPLLHDAERAGVHVVVRPHARHVVSDAPSVQRWLAHYPSLHVLLDPVAMLTESMAATAEDHVARIVSISTPLDRVLGVIVRDGGAGMQAGRLEAVLKAAPSHWLRVKWPS